VEKKKPATSPALGGSLIREVGVSFSPATLSSEKAKAG
jgi:hypothetical protein